jgi:uncharacterized membrane protein
MTDRASEAASTVQRAPRWMKLALVSSLALNLLILGTVGGSIWAFRHAPSIAARGSGPHLLGFTRTMSGERRFEIWKATRHEVRALRPLRKDVRKARAQAREALVAQPFDKDKFAAAQAHVLEAEVNARREAQKLFVSIAAALTPEERAAFAKWQALRRAERGRQSPRDGRPDPAAARQ